MTRIIVTLRSQTSVSLARESLHASVLSGQVVHRRRYFYISRTCFEAPPSARRPFDSSIKADILNFLASAMQKQPVPSSTCHDPMQDLPTCLKPSGEAFAHPDTTFPAAGKSAAWFSKLEREHCFSMTPRDFVQKLSCPCLCRRFARPPCAARPAELPRQAL